MFSPHILNKIFGLEAPNSWLASSVNLPNDVSVHIRSSTELVNEDLVSLEALAGGRNRYVCLQLVTMVKEQVAKNQVALLRGDIDWMHQATRVFFASIAVSGVLVGGALFYPRTAKLQHAVSSEECLPIIDQSLKKATFMPHSLIAGNTINLSVHAGSVSSALVTSTGGVHGNRIDAVCPKQPMELVQSCTLHEMTNPGPTPTDSHKSDPGKHDHVYLDLLCVNTPGKGYGSTLLRHIERFVAVNAHHLEQRQPEWVRIRGIRLLAVSSAQAFYASRGYSGPDEEHEMFKPLQALQHM